MKRMAILILVAVLILAALPTNAALAGGTYYVGINSTISLAASVPGLGSVTKSTWTSSDSRIVAIASSNLMTCTVTGVNDAYGTSATITCSYKYMLAGSVFSGSESFKVILSSGSGTSPTPTYKPETPSTSGKCGDNLTYKVIGTTLVISGSGDMYDYSPALGDMVPTRIYCGPWGHNITEVCFEGDITGIGSFAFYDCRLERITIPNSVTTLGMCCFANITGKNRSSSWPSTRRGNLFTTVTLPASIESVGSQIFKDVYTLEEATILSPEALSGSSMFSGCEALKRVSLPLGLKKLSGFSECTSLEEIAIPYGVETIASMCFYGCRSLKSIYIPDSVKTIGNFAFERCSSLTSLYVPNSVTSLGEDVFLYHGENFLLITAPNSAAAEYARSKKLPWTSGVCLPVNIEAVEAEAFMGTAAALYDIPYGVTAIGERAFADLKSKAIIRIPASVEAIADSAFSGSDVVIECLKGSYAGRWADGKGLDSFQW